MASASRPSGPKAPSKKLPVPSTAGGANVVPPSSERKAWTGARAETIVSSPGAGPACTSGGCASGDWPSATIYRGTRPPALRAARRSTSAAGGGNGVVGDVGRAGQVDRHAGRLPSPTLTGEAAWAGAARPAARTKVTMVRCSENMLCTLDRPRRSAPP